MKEKLKMIIVASVATIGIAGGIACLCLSKDSQDVKQYLDDEKKPTIDDNNINNTKPEDNKDDIQDDVNEPVDNEIENKPVVSKPKPSKPEVSKPSEEVPKEPSNPTLPTDPDVDINDKEELQDLVIANDMVVDGKLIIANKKYNNVKISSDIKSNAKIVFDNIEISDSLIVESPGKYQLDIVNSKIPEMLVTDNVQTFSSLFRSIVSRGINKQLEGATINFQEGSSVNLISIDSNVHVNGTNSVSKINVNNGKEVVLNIPSESLELNTNGYVAINKNVVNMTNNDTATIVVNASVNSLVNNAPSNIRVNKGNTVTSFNNNAEDTVVSGNGNITNAIVSASNTKIFVEVLNKEVKEEVDFILIRQEADIQIVDVKSVAQGRVTFTLSQEVELSLKDLSVICNAGKSITLYNLYTKDNITYTLTTSYFKNDSYALYMTLPNGNIISADFDTDYANPTVENVVVERDSANTATLKLFGVDEGGQIYYILEDALTKEIVTSDVIKRDGKSTSVKVGFNSISLTGLEEGKAYNLYYFIEGFFGNVSKVKGPIEIVSEVKEETNSDYEIVYAKEEISNRFVFKLNKVPEKELTLSDFEVKCPSDSSLTIKNASFSVSPDLLTYIIIVPDNYGHKDNEYTVKIKVSDSETIEKDFATHFNPPVITGAVDNVIRTSETSAEFKFNSDEAGKVYYGIYDWNGGIYDYNSTTPFASDVITGKIECKVQDLHAGSNSILLDLSNIEVTHNTRVWALFVDEVGNYRIGFVDHYKIPEYKDPITEPDTTLEIVDFQYSKSSFKVFFNEEISSIGQDDIKLAVISGGSLSSKIMYIINNSISKQVTIEIPDPVSQLTPGEYELTLNIIDKNGNVVKLAKRFIIE